jgi:N-carbamoylputrescine amidase
VIASNRAGVEGETGAGGAITFHGSSFVCDHRGDKLAELDRGAAGVALATFDLDRLQRARASMGLFRDRRPDLYGRLVK